MLTPKEKAKELVFNFAYAIRDSEDKEGFFTNIIKAKELAKVAVRSHLREWAESEDNQDLKLEYWNNVLTEIDNL